MAIENTSERKRRLNQYEFVAACYLARTHIALGDLERAGEIAATYLDDVDHRVAGNAEFAEGLSLLIRGALAAQFGDQEVACKLGTAGDERIRAHFGDMHAYRLDALLILGDIYTDAGQALEARESYEAGIQIGEDLDLVAHPSFSSHLFGIAGLDESAGNAELAESTRRRAIQLLTTSLGPSSKHALLSGEGG